MQCHIDWISFCLNPGHYPAKAQTVLQRPGSVYPVNGKTEKKLVTEECQIKIMEILIPAMENLLIAAIITSNKDMLQFELTEFEFTTIIANEVLKKLPDPRYTHTCLVLEGHNIILTMLSWFEFSWNLSEVILMVLLSVPFNTMVSIEFNGTSHCS